jgi:ATP-dependent helicase YprA (DUF1998 family)
MHTRLMRAALEVVQSCACIAGCPGCVGPSIGDQDINKRAASTLLARLIDGALAPRPAQRDMAQPSAAVPSLIGD